VFANWRALFKKLLYAPVTEIKFQDIKEFVGVFSESGLPEREEVEYKGWRSDNASNLGSFSEKVVKEIVATANTNGGLIFIGIEEEKDKPEGGRRDYPGTIGTLPVSEANRLTLSIEGKCSSKIRPYWIPEILMVKAPEGDKGVLIIRVDPDKVERPLLCQISEDKWLPFIRRGRQITLPSWDDILEIAEGRVDNEFFQRRNEALRYELHPNAELFIWFTLGLFMRKRRFCEEEPWTDKERGELRSAVNGPLGSLKKDESPIFPWRDVFNSREEVEIRSSLECIRFTSLIDEKFQTRRNELLFSSLGYMVGTVGLSGYGHNDLILNLGKFFEIVFSLTDTFLREQVLKCYQKAFCTEGKVNVFFQVSNSTGKSINLLTSPFTSFTSNRTYGPKNKILIKNSINFLLPETPEKLAKKLTVDFAHAAGFNNLQKQIESLNRDEIENKFFK
jgi:hypothetical protein